MIGDLSNRFDGLTLRSFHLFAFDFGERFVNRFEHRPFGDGILLLALNSKVSAHSQSSVFGDHRVEEMVEHGLGFIARFCIQETTPTADDQIGFIPWDDSQRFRSFDCMPSRCVEKPSTPSFGLGEFGEFLFRQTDRAAWIEDRTCLSFGALNGDPQPAFCRFADRRLYSPTAGARS